MTFFFSLFHDFSCDWIARIKFHSIAIQSPLALQHTHTHIECDLIHEHSNDALLRLLSRFQSQLKRVQVEWNWIKVHCITMQSIESRLLKRVHHNRDSIDCIVMQCTLLQFHSIWFNLIQFDSISSNLIQFDSISSNLIQFDSIWFNFIQFDSIWFNLIQFHPIWFNFIQCDSIWLNCIQLNAIEIAIESRLNASWHTTQDCRNRTCKFVALQKPFSFYAQPSQVVGWLRWVGSLKLYVSFAKEPYTRDDLLRKRPILFKEPTNRSHPVPCFCWTKPLKIQQKRFVAFQFQFQVRFPYSWAE